MEAHHSREECSEDGLSLVVRLVYPVAQGRTEDRPQPVSDSPPCVVGKLWNIAVSEHTDSGAATLLLNHQLHGSHGRIYPRLQKYEPRASGCRHPRPEFGVLYDEPAI
jgi:hypothetical protein